MSRATEQSNRRMLRARDAMDRDYAKDTSTELRLETLIQAPATTVWRAIADSQHRGAWWSYLDLDATVGGKLLERWCDADGREQQTVGAVLEADPGRLLRCTWRDEGWEAPTEVELALRDQDGATRVELRHSGWGDLRNGAQLLAAHREGWKRHLVNLKAYAERLSHIPREEHDSTSAP